MMPTPNLAAETEQARHEKKCLVKMITSLTAQVAAISQVLIEKGVVGDEELLAQVERIESSAMEQLEAIIREAEAASS